MATLETLDRAYNSIMQHILQTGRALHYTGLAESLGLSVEEGRQLLHELVDTGIPAWLYPGTDDIVSFSPFHNLPNQYSITIDGEQKWYGQ